MDQSSITKGSFVRLLLIWLQILLSFTMDQAPVSNQTIWDAIQLLKSDMLSHFHSTMDHIQASLDTIHGSLSTLGEQVLELEHSQR